MQLLAQGLLRCAVGAERAAKHGNMERAVVGTYGERKLNEAEWRSAVCEVEGPCRKRDAAPELADGDIASHTHTRLRSISVESSLQRAWKDL